MFPELNESSVLLHCALRFDGWAYAEMRAEADGGWDFVRLTEDLEMTMLFPEDDLECLAAFFAMQRYLGKWGGEYLTLESRDHVLYRMLFLHCYKLEIPKKFRSREYYDTWERNYRPKREQCAALIRNVLGRRVVGPEMILSPWLFDHEK